MNRFAFLLLAVALAASAARSEQLVCPDQPPAGACVRFHYHVEAWNPATSSLEELTGVNQFATLEDCSSARTIEARRNIAAVDSLLTADARSNAQPNRFGPCHCDMTIAPSNPLYLSDPARQGQHQRYREITSRLRDALLAAGVPPTSEVVAALLPPAAAAASTPVPTPTAPGAADAPPATAPKPESKIEIHWSKDRPAGTQPEPAAASAPDGGTSTSASAGEVVTAPPPVAVADPYSAPGPPVTATAATEPAPGTNTPPSTTAPVSPDHSPASQGTPVSSTTTPATQPVSEPPATTSPVVNPPVTAPPTTTTVPMTELPAGTPATPATSPALDASPTEPDEADPFINLEIARVQQILAAGNSVTDDALKSRIFQAAMERLQLLSNLRDIASTDSGMKIRGSMAAIRGDQARVDFIDRLFGPSVSPHWFPPDAKDSVVPMPDDISSNPAAVMNDPARPLRDRKLALYDYLAKNQSLEASDEIRLAGLITMFTGK